MLLRNLFSAPALAMSVCFTSLKSKPLPMLLVAATASVAILCAGLQIVDAGTSDARRAVESRAPIRLFPEVKALAPMETRSSGDDRTARSLARPKNLEPHGCTLQPNA